MLGMRLIIWIGLPVGVLCLAASLTMLLQWSNGNDLCNSWLAPVLTYCP